MISTLSSATCRVVHSLWGAIAMARKAGDEQGLLKRLKDALLTFRLLYSPQALDVVRKAQSHAIDPFDLWMVFHGYSCDDLDHALAKTLEMRDFYAAPRGRRV
jgi:hypothetical protein